MRVILSLLIFSIVPFLMDESVDSEPEGGKACIHSGNALGNNKYTIPLSHQVSPTKLYNPSLKGEGGRGDSGHQRQVTRQRGDRGGVEAILGQEPQGESYTELRRSVYASSPAQLPLIN